ncbi:unnamed protein product [Caenorhabditis bovis]|uniref:RING-type domain-containing protein n=1 Tax=Caenorhabditis bovis TaxID=2654633 RepID=A0A8S1E9H6_9PELO|nr:unnamed protein product [Caenorhabditis bovis]
MSDSGAALSLHDQIKLASEWGYNQDEIIAALKANTNEHSKEFARFENFDVMLDILNRVSGRHSGSPSKKGLSQPGDMMSTSVTSLYPPNAAPSSIPRRSLSVARSSSFHLATPRSTRDSHDIVRLLSTLEKEKERDRKEVESQFAILKNRITHLESEKEVYLHEIQHLKSTLESQDRELKECREEVARLNEEKTETAETLDKLTIQNFRQQQEIHDQKELAEHRRKTYVDEKMKRDEEILNLQKQINELETELEQKSTLLETQIENSKRLEEQSYQLQPLLLLDDLTKKQSQLIDITAKVVPSMEEIQKLYKEFFNTYPQMEENFRKERDQNRRRLMDFEEKLNSKNRDYQRLQEKCVTECCICLNAKPSIVFLPCRHLISCADCYSTSDLGECPTCRCKIDNSITVFI